MSNLIILISVALLLNSCSSVYEEKPNDKNVDKVVVSPEPQEKNARSLTDEEAQNRFRMIKNVSYKLNFQVQEQKDFFTGYVTIEFEAISLDKPLHLDFYEGKIDKLLVNGNEIKTFTYDNFRIHLNQSLFQSGVNTISVAYNRPFSKDGSGLYKFIDPVDQEEYFYSDFEPFDANKLFPSFDQPDLRATYELQVEAPAKWNVIGNTREINIEDLGLTKKWTFPKSLDFSTYIFALHFGAYQYFEDLSSKVPLRLYFRKSLLKFVSRDQAEWFKVTKEGFNFFETYFSIPYPYGKYDQILVPDFNSGAMENVAAVTFNDGRYVFRTEGTYSQKEQRANVILHELAHMWFGNLVTMKWWNGLWLNESFATFMATLAQAKATDYKDAWQTFFNDIKDWAYWEDNLVTSHPIEAKIPDTASAFNNFDGITYGKGASALKQLNFLLGPESFQKGVENYLKEHSNSNTKLRDFISALEKTSRQDLNEWTKEWLESNGHNRVEINYSCSTGKITHVMLKQNSAEQSKILRTHKSIIALFKKSNNQKLEECK
jgi:aminopeptidase N